MTVTTYILLSRLRDRLLSPMLSTLRLRRREPTPLPSPPPPPPRFLAYGDLERDLDENDSLDLLRKRPPPAFPRGGDCDLGELGRYTSDLGPNLLLGDLLPLRLPPPPPGPPPRGPEKGTRGSMFAPRRATGGSGESLRRGRTMETWIEAPSTWASCMFEMAASASSSWS